MKPKHISDVADYNTAALLSLYLYVNVQEAYFNKLFGISAKNIVRIIDSELWDWMKRGMKENIMTKYVGEKGREIQLSSSKLFVSCHYYR
jgi:hypothetical protein